MTTSNDDDEIVLYILMRTDLASMTRGMAAAHAAHAANLCVASLLTAHPMVQDWMGGRGFGTTIVLDGGCIETIRCAVKTAGRNISVHIGIVHDPEYPVMDGTVTYRIPLDTCGYIFCRRRDRPNILDDIPLLDDRVS